MTIGSGQEDEHPLGGTGQLREHPLDQQRVCHVVGSVQDAEPGARLLYVALPHDGGGANDPPGGVVGQRCRLVARIEGEQIIYASE